MCRGDVLRHDRRPGAGGPQMRTHICTPSSSPQARLVRPTPDSRELDLFAARGVQGGLARRLFKRFWAGL